MQVVSGALYTKQPILQTGLQGTSQAELEVDAKSGTGILGEPM